MADNRNFHLSNEEAMLVRLAAEWDKRDRIVIPTTLKQLEQMFVLRTFYILIKKGLEEEEESNWSNFMKRNPLYDPRIINEIGRFIKPS